MWLLLACAPDVSPDSGSAAPEIVDGCDGLDNDGDGTVDEDPDRLWWADADQDGFGVGAGVATCMPPDGTAPASGDCDDADAEVFPGNDETCDGRDNDCDGLADDGLEALTASWPDRDADGSGDATAPGYTCGLYAGRVANDLDCDDADAGSPVFVAQTGAEGATGGLDTPVVRVAEALARAPRCVWVDDGIWMEDLDLGAGEVVLRSRHGSAATTLLGTGATSVLTVTGKQTVDSAIEGFTIVGGSGHVYTYEGVYNDGTRDYVLHQEERRGGGMLVDGGAGISLRDVQFSGNALPLYEIDYTGEPTQTEVTVRFGLGGGLYVNHGEADLTDVDFVDNEAAYGAGVGLAGGVHLTGRRLRFLGNHGNVGPAIMANLAEVDVSNVIIDGTKAAWDAGGIYLYGVAGKAGSLRLANVTIVDAEAAVITEGTGTVEITNSVIVGNEWGLYDVGAAVGTPSTWSVRWTDVYGSITADAFGVAFQAGLDGNLSVSPNFVSLSLDKDATNDDLHLGEGSPAVDAGDPDQRDVDGTRADMGGYGGVGGGW